MLLEILGIFSGPLGYLALFVGTLLEGEIIVVLGGYLASQGSLNIWGVVLASFVGSMIADQFLFHLAYRKGDRVLKFFPRRYVLRAERLVNRFQTPYILIFRFLYGMRTISPLILGSIRVNRTKFIFLNIIAGIIWSLSFSFGGYFLGRALGEVIKKIQIQLTIIILIVIFVVLFIKSFAHYRSKKLSVKK